MISRFMNNSHPSLSFLFFVCKSPFTGVLLCVLMAMFVAMLGACSALKPAHQASHGSGDITVDRKVEALLAKMTLAEKVGQLNQYSGSWDVTGPVASGDNYNEQRLSDLRSGGVGSMLNIVSVAATTEAQRIAVEETRLGIPLLFAFDVIHGFQTMFPIPLGEAASWDLDLVEKNSRG